MTFWKDRQVAPMGYDIEVKYGAVRHKMLVETRGVGHVTSRTGRNAVMACDFYPYFIPKKDL